MSNVYLDFDRASLVFVHAAVKNARPSTKLYKDAWVWYERRGRWEFHGPDKFYWYGSANSAYDARVQGWTAWLRQEEGNNA